MSSCSIFSIDAKLPPILPAPVNSFIILMCCIYCAHNFAVVVRFVKISWSLRKFSYNYFINGDISNFLEWESVYEIFLYITLNSITFSFVRTSIVVTLVLLCQQLKYSRSGSFWRIKRSNRVTRKVESIR